MHNIAAAFVCLSLTFSPVAAVLPVRPRLKRVSPVNKLPPWLWGVEVEPFI